ncbi:uncharacterized protein LOC119681370 [Teleopsis dalmanni]|nr:uncharacterized protein LOC119681370 [Teleopsis dalmanni]
MKLQLQAFHFSSANPTMMHGHNGYGGQMLNSVHGPNGIGGVGGLVLRCTAQIGELYQEYKEIELGTPQKDPIPARVTLSSGSSMKNFFSSYFLSNARSIEPTAYLLLLAASVVGASRAAVAAAAEILIEIFNAFNQLLMYKVLKQMHSLYALAQQRLFSQR